MPYRFSGRIKITHLKLRSSGDQMSFDLIFRNGLVVDGTMSPPFRADIGLSGECIAAVGDLASATADREIDTLGLIIAPGFIDMHTHADVHVLDSPSMESKIQQGVTT